jgi:hypothetical protein
MTFTTFDDEPRDALSLAQADSVQTALPVAMELPRHKLAGFVGGFSLEAGSRFCALSDSVDRALGPARPGWRSPQSCP